MGGGHHERCTNLAGHLLQVECDDLGGRAIKNSQELVSDPNLRPGLDDLGEAETVTLAVRQLLGLTDEQVGVVQAGDGQEVQSFSRVLPDLVDQRLVQQLHLVDVGDAQPLGVHLDHQLLQDGRFTRAGLARDIDDIALLDLDRLVVEYDEFLVVETQAECFCDLKDAIRALDLGVEALVDVIDAHSASSSFKIFAHQAVAFGLSCQNWQRPLAPLVTKSSSVSE